MSTHFHLDPSLISRGAAGREHLFYDLQLFQSGYLVWMPYHNFFLSIIFCWHYTSITVQPYLRAQPPLRKSSQLAFLTFSAEPKRGQTLCFAFSISLH